MKRVKFIAYRYLSESDFFNIYKPAGTEKTGSGQTYIDFPSASISELQWLEFFAGVESLEESGVKHGKRWEAPIRSIGSGQEAQSVALYQRRPQTVSIAAQHISANRVAAWRPDHGFPQPQDPSSRHELPEGLAIFLVRTYENDVWAGWFMTGSAHGVVSADPATRAILSEMHNPDGEDLSEAGDAGFGQFEVGTLLLDEHNAGSPFHMAAAPAGLAGAVSEGQYDGSKREEEEIARALFSEDQDLTCFGQVEPKEKVVKIRTRNTKAVKALKGLYGYRCQVTGGEQFVFEKRDGTGYVEAHHLVPLGEGGSDDPRNIVVINALFHRMLHYGTVSPLDLSAIEVHADGFASLNIEINGVGYLLRWHPKHAELVLESE